MKHFLPPELSLAKRSPRMSVIGGRAENICSFRVFLSLTQTGNCQTWIEERGQTVVMR
jgi:hypothetical protein